MNVAAELLVPCPRCKRRVDVKSPHVAITGTSVRVYCSADCLEARDTPIAEPTPIEPPPKRRTRWWIGAGVVAAGASFGIWKLAERDDTEGPPTLSTIPTPAETPNERGFAIEDPRKEADANLLVELMHDAWLHPLAGPDRRMPRTHNGAFGAERGGDRPPECISGHCGVDLGQTWGEPVHAVHAGVVDYVERGPNEDRGGIFVKLAHRGGTLYSWYFHLAAVPRWVRPGATVAAGQIIGLVGDTGVSHSAPHLHFSISVKSSKGNERYLDPEPLIAIWPLWIPGESSGRLATAEPGMPMRAPARRKKSKSKRNVDVAPDDTKTPVVEGDAPPITDGTTN